MRSFRNGFILGSESPHSFADSKSKSFAASGARRDSIDLFLSSLASLFRWDAVMAVRFLIITVFKCSSSLSLSLPLRPLLVWGLALSLDLYLGLGLLELVADLDLDLDLELDRVSDREDLVLEESESVFDLMEGDPKLLDLEPELELDPSLLGESSPLLFDLLPLRPDPCFGSFCLLSGLLPPPFFRVRFLFSLPSFLSGEGECRMLGSRLGLLSGSSLFITSWAVL